MTEEKIYECTGTWVQRIAELNEFYNPLLCYLKPRRDLAPSIGKKSTGISHLRCLVAVHLRYALDFTPMSLLYGEAVEELAQTRLLSFWQAKGSSIKVLVCFLSSFMFQRCAIKSWANLTFSFEQILCHSESDSKEAWSFKTFANSSGLWQIMLIVCKNYLHWMCTLG